MLTMELFPKKILLDIFLPSKHQDIKKVNQLWKVANEFILARIIQKLTDSQAKYFITLKQASSKEILSYLKEIIPDFETIRQESIKLFLDKYVKRVN